MGSSALPAPAAAAAAAVLERSSRSEEGVKLLMWRGPWGVEACSCFFFGGPAGQGPRERMLAAVLGAYMLRAVLGAYIRGCIGGLHATVSPLTYHTVPSVPTYHLRTIL
jgi:hypothetical protein